MQNHKISRIIKAIYHKEPKDFEAWFRGKNKGKDTYAWRLWQIATRKEGFQWEDTRVWKVLFPGEPFNKKRYNREISNLFRPLMKFLPFLQLKKEPHTWKLFQLRAMNQRPLFKEFDWLWKKHFVPLKAAPQKNTRDFHLLYQAELEKHNRLQQGKKKKNNLPQAFASFQTYWMLDFLQMACYSLSHNQIHGEEISTQSFDAIIALIDQEKDIVSQPLYQVYRPLYDVLADRHTDVSLIEKITEHQDQLSQEDTTSALALALNFFTRRINSGYRDQAFFDKLITLYQTAFEAKLLHYYNLQLQPGHYHNLISLCNRIEKYELAKHYIETWKEELPENVRQQAYSINLSHYYFYVNQYSLARRMIRQVDRQDPKIEVRMKFLELRMFYEEIFAPVTYLNKKNDTDEIDKLKTQIKALLRYIKTQKSLSNLHKDPYSSRLKLFQRLLTARTENSLQKLRKKLLSDHSIDYVRWLLEKVNQRLKNEYGFTP
jgi:tetratricopeptide (TPR) repeat protein